MTTVKFNNSFGEMELEATIRSVFDRNIAGQIATDGIYYVIHFDHKKHECYALTKESERAALALGHSLDEDGEEAVFHGERVRAMTMEENFLYDSDHLFEHVDLWGNVAVDEPFNQEEAL